MFRPWFLMLALVSSWETMFSARKRALTAHTVNKKGKMKVLKRFFLFVGIVWDFMLTRWLFPTQRHSSDIVFKAPQWGGIPEETAIKSTAGWVQLPVNIVGYSFKKNMFSLHSPDCFCCRRLLHLPDPFSSHRWPRKRKCRSQERQVSSSGYNQQVAEFLLIVSHSVL